MGIRHVVLIFGTSQVCNYYFLIKKIGEFRHVVDIGDHISVGHSASKKKDNWVLDLCVDR